MNAGQIIGTLNGQQVVGLDIAKHVFQLPTVDMGTGEIVNVLILRTKVLEHFVNKSPCLITAPEACWPMPKSRDRGLKGSRPAGPPMSSSWRRRPRWPARSGL